MSGVPSIGSSQGHTIQALAPDGQCSVLTVTSSSSNVQLPLGRVVEVAATQNCWISWGNSSGVTAAIPAAGGPNVTNSMLFTAGQSVYIIPDGITWIAAILDQTTSGKMSIKSFAQGVITS